MQQSIIKNKFGYYELKDKPTEDELAGYYEKKYYQEASGGYEASYTADELEWFNNKIAERLYIAGQHLPKNHLHEFLDIGCGEGWALQYFKNKGWNVTGLDYSSFGCKKFNPGCGENLITGNIYQNLTQLITQDKKYTLVWIDNVLEHVIDPEYLVNAIKKIIEPGGILIIEVPNDYSALQTHLTENKIVDREYWVITPDHLSYFDREGLTNLMAANGYRVLDFIGDYPIDINLLNTHTNYVMDKTRGKACHLERVAFDNLVHKQPIAAVVDFYRACSGIGMGRCITGFFSNK